MQGFAYAASSLVEAHLPNYSSQTSNGFWWAFYACSALRVIDFSEATRVIPRTTNDFPTQSTLKFIVPDALYSQWIVASGWSSIAS
jgi:hypothetical protein